MLAGPTRKPRGIQAELCLCAVQRLRGLDGTLGTAFLVWLRRWLCCLNLCFSALVAFHLTDTGHVGVLGERDVTATV